MSLHKTAKAVTIKDATALKLLSERATRERRSVTSAAVITVIEHLDSDNTHKHNFHDDIIEKGMKGQE